MNIISEGASPLKEAVKVSSAVIAEGFRKNIGRLISEKYALNPPKLVGFLANDDAAAKKYAHWTAKACVSDGIKYELREVSRDSLEECVRDANSDKSIHGIIVYYPVFGKLPHFVGTTVDDYIRDTISPKKDVEGLCYTYRNNLYRNVRFLDERDEKKCILPCTALSLVKILEHLQIYNGNSEMGNRLSGVTATIINRSDIVGRPLAAMLSNDGATVYSVDIDSTYRLTRGKYEECSEDVRSAIQKSSVVITGVPSQDYRLPIECIQENTVVLNFSRYKNLDPEALMKIRGVRYVPLIGKVTVAMLERNLLRLYENFLLD